jgi:preprotein translocase subunit SecG
MVISDSFECAIFFFFFFFLYCLVFKIVNTEEKRDLKLCLDGLENRKRNWEYMFGKVN